MPPIVPTPPELLSAPDPTQAPVANGASPPVAPPATSPVYTTRRMTIFYQDQGTTPVPPSIDGGIDIAQPVLERYAQYVGERTQTNNIPVVGAPIQPAGFSNQQPQEGQQTYINTIPKAKDEFTNVPTQFPLETVTPDALGVNYKNIDANGPRNKAIYEYNRFFVDLNNAENHQAIVNETLLTTRGHDPSNPFVTTDISQNKNDNRITLGSYFYKNAGNLSNGVNYATGSYVKAQPATATDAPPMTIEAMKDIGLNIMFEAVQGRAGLDYAVRSTDSIAGVEARMAIPSEQRIGKRVSLGRFTPAFQIKKLTGAEKPNNANFIDNTDDIQTYGSLYNVYSQFDSLISLGQIALCVAMILAYVILLSGLTALINAFNLIGDNEAQNRASPFVNLENNEKQRLLGASVLQNSGVYPLSQVDAGDIAAQFLGVSGIFSYTRHRTEECLNAGIQEFFGFSFSGFGTTAGSEGTGVTATQQLAGTSLKVLTESGRLNVILRELLRSGISLVEDTAVDFTGGASIAGIGNLIRKIRDLKIVRFINVLLGMGDKVKFETDIRTAAGLNVSGSQINETYAVVGSNISYIDSLPDNRTNYISKSRLSNQTSLAWSNKTAGMLSLPLGGGSSSFSNSGLGKYDRNGFSTHWDEMNMTVGSPTSYEGSQLRTLTGEESLAAAQRGRLPANVVNDVENALEADFMPFYIHDLRTNEILSFHAFLEDANEDFSVEYTAQDGYGRMDKVQIYKGTTRTVSVNFKMVATNPEDHDIMWYKVNRLAMMIYPQWTQGRKITVDNLKFIQPFSQIPGATPVIRLRLGDLYKTNYSKMAVARLFGVSTLEDYNIDSRNNRTPTASTAPAPATGNPATQTAPVEIVRANKITSGIPAATVTIAPGSNRHIPQGTYALNELFAPNDELVFYTRVFPHLSNYYSNNQRIGTDSHNNNRIIATVQSVGRNSISVKPIKYVTGPVTSNIENINTVVPNQPITGRNGQPARNVTMTIADLNRRVNTFDAVNTAKLLQTRGRNSQTAQNAQQNPEQATQALTTITPQTFYDENQNPIMKAFKSSGGKGLAGVITSFKVDYGEAKGNWGIDGSEYLRAPMFVTIQLQMAVIHDITPGLDAKGIMLAPIWPVGKTSNYFVNNGRSTSEQAAVEAGQIPTPANPINGNQNGLSSVDGNDYFAVDKGTPLYYDRKD